MSKNVTLDEKKAADAALAEAIAAGEVVAGADETETVAETETVTETETEAGVKACKVQSLTPYQMTHPVTGALFLPRKPVDIADLSDDSNAFVRHQIEAGIFEIVEQS